jgi:hypothetical protein
MTAPVVDAFVDELGRAVRGPGRVRRSMLREVHDGLTDAAEAHLAGGLDPVAAQAQAVAEFGTVDELAAHYQAELTVRRGRATALFVAVVFPSMMLGWELMWRAGVSWGPPKAPAEAQTLRTLSWLVDTTSLASAAIAVVVFGLTFLRAVPPRLVTVLAGFIAGAGVLVTGGLSFWMNVVGNKGEAAMAVPGPAIVAYTVSLAVLVVSVVLAARAIRTAAA